jgi:cell division septum initiation protein DivIVA
MKKIFKISGITVVILLAILIILPFLFQGAIIRKIKEETNKNLKAKIDFNDYGLSLFRSFPDFSLSIDQLSIVGVEEFSGDTLANVPKLYVTIDLMSVFKGSEYKIKKIELNKPSILLKGLENGHVNWDITIKDTLKTTKTEEPSNFKIAFKKIEINNANLTYDDAKLGFILKLKDLNHSSKGDMTAEVTTLKTKTYINEIDVVYGGIKYLSKSNAEVKLNLGMNLKEMKFTFEENETRLNQLFFNFEGFFTMLKEGGYDMDIKLKTDKTDFKNILSLVPSIYSKEFDKLQSEGKFVLDGFVKGKYTNLEQLPAFKLNLQVIKGMFKYPSLPNSVNNVNINTTINNNGGNADNTTINISKFHIEIANNPVDLTLYLSNPISDPAINLNFSTNLNFENINKIYPLEETKDLKGSLSSNITIKGKVSSIQQKKYNEFSASGFFELSNFILKNKEYPQGINIKKSRFNFNPSFLELAQFNMMIGKNDFEAKGKIENYIPYILKKETVKANLITRSDYFNLNDFISKNETKTINKTEEKSKDTSVIKPIDIPDNIDFYFQSDFKKLIYGNMEMDNVNGIIEMKDKEVVLKNLSVNVLEGKMTITGSYSSKIPSKPSVNFSMDVNNFNIPKTANTITTFDKIVPIAKRTSGYFNTKFKISASLDKNMNLDYNSIESSGILSTTNITVENSETFNKISDAIKVNKFKKLNLSPIKLAYIISEGKIKTEPFDIKSDNIKANISGTSSFDQTIDYKLRMEVPRKEMGSVTNSFIESLTGKASQKGVDIKLNDIIKFDVFVVGTITNPQIKTGLKESVNNLANDLKDKAKEAVEQKKEEVINKAKAEADKAIAEARQKAQQLIDEANRQGELLRNEAKKQGDRLIAEADNQGNKLINEANNPIAKVAAKKTAEKLHKEAVDKANKLNLEADQKANDLVNKAKMQGDQIIKAAEEKYK